MARGVGWRGRGAAGQRWATFVRNHAHALIACDFCVAVTATFRLLYVFVTCPQGLVHPEVSFGSLVRINGAARLAGLSYRRLMSGLRKAGVSIDRKMLADLAVRDAAAFNALANLAKARAAA
jgi:hypothetical protein